MFCSVTPDEEEVICAMFLDGSSFADLASKYGTTVQTIRKVLKVGGIDRDTPRKPPSTRICYACRETKPIEDFERQNSKTGQHGYICKPCKYIRDKARAKRYQARRCGTTVATVEALRKLQGNRCAICGRAEATVEEREEQSLTKPVLHLDHNATTGKVRGFLCGSCNRGIGLLHEDVAALRKATEYLANPPAESLGDIPEQEDTLDSFPRKPYIPEELFREPIKEPKPTEKKITVI